ncbi:hypothetical protein SAMN05444161_0012 [Rhizobiales bacterium GAS191]|nr:hypothetical protein SAMN05444161_0012 [Rhizobiales bacterium GAS191]
MTGEIITKIPGAVIHKTTLDAARFPPKAGMGLPPNRPRRRPLKFTPIIEAGEISDPVRTEAAFTPLPPPLDLDEATSSAAATVGMVLETLDSAVAIGDERLGPLRVKLAGMQVENAQLRSAIAELKSEIAQISFIVERLSIDRQGPPGAAGPRGRDGRDGPPGMRGETGPRGETGKAAPKIVGWEVHEETYEARPLLSDSSRAPVLRLRGLFEQFDADSDATDAIEEADAAAAKRDEAERERERQRWVK